MRANQKFVEEVAKKVDKMRKDDAISYLRGTLQISGNSATTDKLRQILERVRGK